jgi:O-antigen ligase
VSQFKPSGTTPGLALPNRSVRKGQTLPAVPRNPAWRVPAAPIARADSTPDSALRRLGLYAAVGYVFVRFTFLHEILALTLGLHSYLPPLFGIPALAGVVLGGGLQRAFRLKTVFLWLLFAAWLVAGIPFSSWPGNSLQAVFTYIKADFPILLMIAGLTRSWRDLKLIIGSLACAGILNELTAKYLSRDVGGRLELTGIVTIGNANDFAAHLLMLLPFMVFVGLSKEYPKILRILMLPATLFALSFSLRTGSRGALLALALTYAVIVITGKGASRLVVALAIPLVAAAYFAVLPGELTRRFATIFSPDDPAAISSSGGADEAVASADGRKYLLLRGIELTLQHPLFGVGVADFAVSEGSTRAGGLTGKWMAPHNTYTQVSSETGIPGLLILMTALAASFALSVKVRRQASRARMKGLPAAAYALMISFVLFCSCAFFLSLAYSIYFPTLAGLALAMVPLLRAEPANAPALRANGR